MTEASVFGRWALQPDSFCFRWNPHKNGLPANDVVVLHITRYELPGIKTCGLLFFFRGSRPWSFGLSAQG